MASADFTIPDFLAWARTKPADEGYSWGSPCDCAVGQFAATTRHRVCGPERMQFEFCGPIGDVVMARPHTFGGLVNRLEALCPETPVTQSDWAAIDAYLTDIEQVSA